jgi:hypothetical protein
MQNYWRGATRTGTTRTRITIFLGIIVWRTVRNMQVLTLHSAIAAALIGAESEKIKRSAKISKQNRIGEPVQSQVWSVARYERQHQTRRGDRDQNR